MKYYKLDGDIYANFGVTKNPDLHPNAGFLNGRIIPDDLIKPPLAFEVDYPSGHQPEHMLGDSIPIVSNTLLEVLKNAGVDNLQIFPALLINPTTKEQWDNYFAFNVIGMLDAANMDQSKFDEIMEGDDHVPALVDFEDIVLDRSKTYDLRMFRIIQSPEIIFVRENVIAALSANRPKDGWGLTVEEVDVI